MVRKFVAVFSLLITMVYCYLLYQPIKTSQGTLPPIGRFLNPFSGFWQNAEPISPQSNDVTGASISNEVEVILDERLVPHLYGSNQNDLAFVQGYLHAKYRLWEMDISARQASGRLAEVFGSALLENDRRMRKMGMSKSAEEHVQTWQSCEDYDQIVSYVAGVNQYIDDLAAKDYPLEFKLLNYTPELWSDYHTALVMMSMNLSLCGRNEDIAASNTIELFGKDMFEYLFPRWNPRQSPVIPKSVMWDFQTERGTKMDSPSGMYGHRFIQPAPRYVGSNNWAVSGDLTISGNPILCNDPHLNLSLPSIWYEMQLTSQDYSAYGVTLPGVPNIIIGFNEDIAWGQTNVGIDVSDFYVIEWTDDTKTSYYLDGEIKDVEIRVEKYQVSNGSEHVDTVKYTSWGPVFFDDSVSLALKWLPHTSGLCSNSAFRLLNRAKNYDEFISAISYFGSPPQNFVFASRSGDIALKVQGQFPLKAPGEGQFIMEGNKGINDWNGFIPIEETPTVKNPDRGFVSSANQSSTDTTYPHRYHGYFDDYRGRILNMELEEMQRISIDDMKKLQNSTYNLMAAELCPWLMEETKTFTNTKWWSMLKNWDYQYDADDVEPIFIEHWLSLFRKSTWDEWESLSEDRDILYPENWRLIDMAISNPDHQYFDIINTPEKETAGDIARDCFSQAASYCDSLFEVNKNLTWSDHKQLQINHLTRIRAFSEWDITAGGVATSLNSIKKTHGPSWRMVVDLSTPIKAWGIYPGGQSGNPGSPYYANMIKDWSEGKYYQLHFSTDMEDLTEFTLMKQTFSR